MVVSEAELAEVQSPWRWYDVAPLGCYNHEPGGSEQGLAARTKGERPSMVQGRPMSLPLQLRALG